MIHDEICTYEVSKLAKKKGFDIHCVPFYALEDFTAEYIDDIGEFYEVDFEKGYLYLNYPIKGLLHKEKMLPAPTQSLLQGWLREEKGIHIVIESEPTTTTSSNMLFQWIINYNSDGECYDCYNDIRAYPSYEKTLESALKFVLENLV